MKQSSDQKLGFLALISIVISAELGASIFLLPSSLAQFGTFGLVGWLIGGVGAVFIAIVFAFLCTNTSKSGGPHIYAQMFFGKKIGFFVTWIYWCASWACNPIIIATSINYLVSFTGELSIMTRLFLEIGIVLSLTMINTKGVKTSGNIEIALTLLKILPLIAIPILAFSRIDFSNFGDFVPKDIVGMKAIVGATIVSFWGFVGLEGGASQSDIVRNPKKNIPIAIICGTLFVAVISFVNTFSIFGLIPFDELQSVGAPFAQVMVVLFGGSFEKALGILTFIMCFGSLNAWVFFSGQIARTASLEGMMPKSIGVLNKNNSPAKALWVSAMGTVFILCVLKLPVLKGCVEAILNMSVVVYIALYTMAIFAYVKFMKSNMIRSVLQIFVVVFAFLFCLLVLFNTEISHFVFLLIMILTGVPVYRKLKK